MNVNSNIPEQTVISTFRNLPAQSRQVLSLPLTQFILLQKKEYYEKLSYTEKCLISTERLTEVLYRRLKKYQIKIRKASIRNILMAEEQYYLTLSDIYT
ncbi:hypothetical protein AAG747_06210 [Rapidithrix thailandica]|uniref:Uncharacterized protein n=1 Tax=Rapidithrix thailandica TaxID=413964 RepID=A0AAW9S9W2_9BACT